MILSCNSCEKKFVVPDSAIGASGRLVQCSSCGNKWKQFPVISKPKAKPKEKQPIQAGSITNVTKKIKKTTKTKRKKIKNNASPSLYSPEYLSKKHGIIINKNPIPKKNESKNSSNINFGFYNFSFVSIIIAILLLRLLYFAQEIIVENFPILEIYINYLFESINNIKEIIQNFFSSY